jgi:rhodanese-related sulfurtransferase
MQKVFAILALIALAFAPAAMADAPTHIDGAKTVNADQLIDMVTKNSAVVVIDSRKSSDFTGGHIQGAYHLENKKTDAASLAQALKTKNTPAVFYCNGLKCGRAADAVKKALKHGYTNVYYYAKGMEEWKAKGLPVLKD